MPTEHTLCLSLGGTVLGLCAPIPLETRPGTAAFRCDAAPDVTAALAFSDGLPPAPGTECGEDGIFRYYRDASRLYQLAMPGTDGSVSLAVYDPERAEIQLHIDEGAFPGVVRTADKVLQLLPMKQLLAHYGAFLLHSSRIAVQGRAILFTAPSQTGKTTQARLWQRFGGAEIAGNDRTLLWPQDGDILTSGYPVDGSSPVYSSARLPLGAIVALRQGSENRIQRLKPLPALRALMGQTALDAWDGEELAAAQQLWAQVLTLRPMYLLECRPDEGAVQCLRDQLTRDEVI